MPTETHHPKPNERSGLRDLDDVVLLAAVSAMDGASISAGTEGTVVSVLAPGKAYLVEFPEPEGALATVEADGLALRS